MTLTPFQRLALVALLAVEILLWVGAVVRSSGSGLGCPDWPFCYGQWVPPTSAQQIDFEALDLERFRRKAAALGRDPAQITADRLRAEFDPVATWVEYLNRLTSLPVGLSVLSLWLASFGQWRRGRADLFLLASMAIVLVGVNAWLGARVVLSGLKPGIITLHMALAILLLLVLVHAFWRSRGPDFQWPWPTAACPQTSLMGWLLLGLIIFQGVMGSQVRELTDALAHSHVGVARREWIGDLEHSTIYLVHRSFTWVILIVCGWFMSGCRQVGRLGFLEKTISGIVMAQMVLGIWLAHRGIDAVVQVLHVGLSSLLVVTLYFWLLLAGRSARRD